MHATIGIIECIPQIIDFISKFIIAVGSITIIGNLTILDSIVITLIIGITINFFKGRSGD